jgi:beta-glucosidase
MTGILRDEWKFPGTVVSDWAAIRELIPHGLAADLPDAARLALHAGTDVDMESDAYRTAPEGKLPTTELDQAVRRVLKLKTDLGLFEHPYVPDSSPYQPTQENLELARKAAEQSFVLLRNDDHLLPLDVSKVKLALIGPFADDKGEMLGSWSASGNAIDVHTLREELTARLGDRLAYQKGTEILGNSTDGFAAAVTAVQHSDVAVLTLGESGPNMTGEASSRAHLDLPGNQKQLLEAVVATGKPVVLLLFNGRPLAIPWAAQHVTAILDAWFPGLSAGPALANVLFGNVNPSGKLPVEFPHSVGQEPLFLSQLPTGRPAVGVDLTHSPANAREKYLSRYIDETNDPVYPFGWGLSYSTFEYSHPAITIAPDGSSLRVKATLTNTGNLNASEIAQLYFRRPVAVPAQPVRELKGFERITLKPGESHDLSFTITQNDLAFYDGRELKKAIDGKLQFWVGGNSNTTNEVDAVSADRVFRVTQ